MRNQQGFAQIFLISILPVMIGAFIIFHSLTGLIQLNTIVNSECRRQQISTQVEIRKLLLKLLSKNPRAIALRTQLVKARVLLAAAIASQNILVMQYQQSRITYLSLQRQILDIHQKEFIAQANLIAIKSSFQIYSQVLRNIKESKSLNPILQFSTNAFPPISPRLAVVPEFPDVAPVYRPAANFSEQQAFVQKWQYHIRVNTWLQHFVKADARFEKLCSTTIEPEDNQWKIITKEDKS